MTHIKRSIALLLLAASLVMPTGVFAASTSGTSTETLDVADTISATFPGNQTYGNGGTDYTTPLAYVTVVSTNAANGVTIKARASVYDGPGTIEVSQTERKAALSNDTATGSGADLVTVGGGIAAGTFATPTTDVTLASSTGPLAGRRVGVEWLVAKSAFVTGGAYTSTVTYTASTNP